MTSYRDAFQSFLHNLRFLFEFECGGIDAIAHAGGCGPVRKYVAEMGIAFAAKNFDAHHAEA